MKREDFNMKVLFGKRKERKICMVCMYIWYVCIYGMYVYMVCMYMCKHYDKNTFKQ